MLKRSHAIHGCLIVALCGAVCHADGGAVRTIERDGSLQISVFTSPNPLVAGPADLSVLLQDAETLAPVDASRIEVTIVPRDRPYASVTRPATQSAATNKLFRACLVELEPGWYDVLVKCDAGSSTGRVEFAMQVGPAPPQLAVLWPWFCWPIVPVALFGLHQMRIRKKYPESL